MKIGFIGLGIMGKRMAANLLKGGHKITVYNRTSSKAADLLQEGALWADSPEEVAIVSDVLITMLEGPAVVEKLALGEKGFLDALKKRTIWIDSSTVDPFFSKRMADEAKNRGIKFLDAPVSGSKVPAGRGDLVFLVGGNLGDLEEVRPLLDLMGKKIVHLGANGKGSAFKLMINLLLGQTLVAFSESLSLGIALGIDKTTAMDILLDSSVTPPILKNFRSRIEGEDFKPHFPLKHMRKDLQLISKTAYELERSIPLTSAVKEIYTLAHQKKLGELDFSSVFRFLNE